MPLRQNDGQALIMVVISIAILYVITASLGSITGHTHKNMISELELTQALYAADAGIENTIGKVLNDSAWYEGLSSAFTTVFNNQELTAGVVYGTKIKKVNNTDQVFGTEAMIESVGQCINAGNVQAKKTLQCYIAVYTANDYFKGLTVLPGEAVGATVTGSAAINSPVICSSDLTLGDSLTVVGNNPVYTGGELTLADSASCDAGNVQQSYSYIPPVPDLDDSYYQILAAESGAEHLFTSGVSDPTYTFPNSHIDTKQVIIPDSDGAEATVYLYSGCYYVNGDLNISGCYQGKAVIFASGDIKIASDLVSVNDYCEETAGAGDLTLIALGNIMVEESKVYANLMARGVFQTSGAVILQGAVCASGIDLGRSHFDLNFNSLDVNKAAIPVTVKVYNWQELYPVIAGTKVTVVMRDEKNSA